MLKRLINRFKEQIIEQADEIAELRAELAVVKPPWSDMPEWVKYIARDNDYTWGMFSEKPTTSSHAWYIPYQEWHLEEIEVRHDKIFGGNWQDTLEQRPKTEYKHENLSELQEDTS